MSEEKKQLPTQKLRKVKKWSEMTPQEKEELDRAFREELRKYYENCMSREHIMASMEEAND